MGIKEFYSEIGSSYKDVADRLGSEDFILHFVVKFKEDENFDGDIARAKGLFPHVSEKYAAVLKAIQGL